MNFEMAQEWLKAADDDLKIIEKIIDDKNLTHMVAFHAQQAIEKTFKAILEYRGDNVQKIHSTFRLYYLIEDFFSIDNPGLLDTIDTLYIESRYPGNLGLLPDGKPSLDEAQEFYNFALDIVKTIKEKIIS